MKFTSVAPNSEDVVVIPDGYKQAVVISWGDPVLPNAPKFDVRNQTAAIVPLGHEWTFATPRPTAHLAVGMVG